MHSEIKSDWNVKSTSCWLKVPRKPDALVPLCYIHRRKALLAVEQCKVGTLGKVFKVANERVKARLHSGYVR